MNNEKIIESKRNHSGYENLDISKTYFRNKSGFDNDDDDSRHVFLGKEFPRKISNIKSALLTLILFLCLTEILTEVFIYNLSDRMTNTEGLKLYS